MGTGGVLAAGDDIFLFVCSPVSLSVAPSEDLLHGRELYREGCIVSVNMSERHLRVIGEARSVKDNVATRRGHARTPSHSIMLSCYFIHALPM